MAAVSDLTVKIHADTSDFQRAVRKARRDVWWLLHPRLVLALWAGLLLTVGFLCGLLVQVDRHWLYSDLTFTESGDEALADLYAATLQCPDCGLYHEPSEGRDETR